MIQHLALIMDGNRRWAKKRSLRPWLGHNAGVESIREVIQFCMKTGIKYVSLYAFSLENFKRSPEEVTFLFELFVKAAKEQLSFLKENGIQVHFIGDRDLFPTQVINSLSLVEEETKDCTALKLNFLFCYGSQQELVAAAKQIAHKVKQGLLTIADITCDTFSQTLWTAGTPDPELIIRTGGKKRLSNFLLYQAAYSELYFLDCLWPDLKQQHLHDALSYFTNEQRNFGT